VATCCFLVMHDVFCRFLGILPLINALSQVLEGYTCQISRSLGYFEIESLGRRRAVGQPILVVNLGRMEIPIPWAFWFGFAIHVPN
jgi:hypothetical protein